VQATIGYFTSPSNQVLPTPIAKPKEAPVTPLPLKTTEPQIPELMKPKDVMKPQVKRVDSIGSLSERGTNGTTTATTSVTSVGKPVPPPQTNGRPIPGLNGLPAQPQDPRPKKKPKLPPRPNPGASLFIPSKKVCPSSSFSSACTNHLAQRPPPDGDLGGPSKRRQ